MPILANEAESSVNIRLSRDQRAQIVLIKGAGTFATVFGKDDFVLRGPGEGYGCCSDQIIEYNRRGGSATLKCGIRLVVQCGAIWRARWRGVSTAAYRFSTLQRIVAIRFASHNPLQEYVGPRH